MRVALNDFFRRKEEPSLQEQVDSGVTEQGVKQSAAPKKAKTIREALLKVFAECGQSLRCNREWSVPARVI